MKVKIKLLRPFSDAIGKNELELDIHGNKLENLLRELVTRYPKLKNEIYTKKDELTDYICIFVNDKPSTALNGMDSELKNDDEILFFIPVSGG